MKTAEDIVRALAAVDDKLGQCEMCEALTHAGRTHESWCPRRMAREWVAEREAIREDLRRKGWTLLSDGYWSANETGPLDKRGMIWQDRMIDLDPESSRRILAAIEKVTPPPRS